ncbi:aa3-type cytochrome oxidase subunit I [Streptomyces sp. S465]|uniref:aa3-type cytochrome oxidase subunit I n=1 Tax=Streptomyces sp. S465 TaxID=2979468 RepID=UPI0022A85245|nr:cytochrome c oxidase subunit I [Streptomyces sp. S465]WAP56062.1 cytochrome c oxidase subunit I [Streptomyces sp. S465]
MATTTKPDFEAPAEPTKLGRIVVDWLTTTDHKKIGHLYLVTAFGFFLIAGLLAMVMRAELARPGLQLISPEQYNQAFTLHGTLMLLFFATPVFAGFANEIMPLQIGAPDVAFPRLNMLSYWLFLFGGLIVIGSLLTPQGAADYGWTAYTPLSSKMRAPGTGSDLWVMGLALSGFGTILGAVNFITTIVCMRAPGMTMFRLPIFTWNILFTSILVLIAFPVLAAALLVLEADRKFGAVVFEGANGGPVLWQHLFWFFGHPEVYIIALPFFGIITEIIPVFSRKVIFGYMGLVGATIAITGLSATVWAHHMFATGAVLLPFFSFMTFLIAVPTGVKFFNWTGTMWRGSLSFETPMLWAIGFLVTFLFGGLTGVILASPPLDFEVHDSYFVVAHFHYVVFGTVVFAMFAGFYFWWPKFTGTMLDERLGKIHFWTLFIGFHATFLVHHWLGANGMPRRYADYLAADGFTALNTVSTIGSFLLGLSTLPFVYNVWRTGKYGKRVATDDPWGWGRSLEWATSCPPPRHNFLTLPQIRSESPAFDLHHPEVVVHEVPTHHGPPLSGGMGAPLDLGTKEQRTGGEPGPEAGGGSEEGGGTRGRGD